MFFRDLDTGKAILIYAASLMESGELQLRLGLREAGVKDLELAGRINPELLPQVRQILGGFGVRR